MLGAYSNFYGRKQAHDSIMYPYFCIGFIDLMSNRKSFTDFAKLFPLINSKENKIL